MATLREETLPIHQFAEKAYLDYSMYVILDRALPHLADGLKPVQRRIIYAMSELGLDASAKHKKSARTVGDVLGKFHPHGDLACYEAMVLMAQPFSTRYPLIDGQGNFGSYDDPKSFAAMRYTESKLTAYAGDLLKELEEGTVDFQPNFDGTLKEPILLPAKLPNVLLNGAQGIAVGMSTDVPPHHAKEIIDALVTLIEQPELPFEKVCALVQGPDFPSGGEIVTPRSDIVSMYRTGTGSLKVRATFKVEKEHIIIDSLPYQTSASKILEQVAAQMNQKKLPMLLDLRDESDEKHPVRLVLVLRSSRVETEALMQHLFATTDLERSIRVNMNMIGLDHKPAVRGLRTILKEWLDYRRMTLRRRTEFRLEKIVDRLEILKGYRIAHLNIDEVIRIVRNEDNPKQVLRDRFELTERQADAILELRLRQLAKLEEIKIQKEQEALLSDQETLDHLLRSDQAMSRLMIEELRETQKKYSDPRRTRVVEREAAQAFSEDLQISHDPITVVLSKHGWIRAGKGHELDPESLNYKTGDAFLSALRIKMSQSIILLDSTGRCYTLSASNLPSVRGQGEPLSSLLAPPSGASFLTMTLCEAQNPMLLVSSDAYGFIATAEDLVTRQRSGKAVLKLAEGAYPLTLSPLNKDAVYLALLSSKAKMLIFPIAEVPSLAKGRGNKLMGLGAGETVIACACISKRSALVLLSSTKKKSLSPEDWKSYLGKRTQKGLVLPQGYTAATAFEVV